VDGHLTIENLDNVDWSYYFEPSLMTLWISPPQGNGIGGVAAHSSTMISMKVGTYRLRLVGSKNEGLSFNVYETHRTALTLARVQVDGKDALQANLFENGERKGSATLGVFSEIAMTVPAAQTEYVQAPSTTYIYTEPRYYYDGPYYGGGIYYGPRYYYGGGFYGGRGGYRSGGFGLGFGFSGGGHRR
jgi:hypothetical protein